MSLRLAYTGRIMGLAFAVLAGNGCLHNPLLSHKVSREVDLTRNDRVLVLAPHPDDEVLACGGIIQKAVALGIPLRVVFYTYGDNNEWSFLIYRKHPVLMPYAVRAMGDMRHEEALKAADVLGVAAAQLVFLGYPDFGTLSIWNEHWDDAPPYRSMLTSVVAVPYASAMRPGAPYKGEEIVDDLKTVFKDFKPTKIFVSSPADHNPDHRALYLFTRIALWDSEGEIRPSLYPYLTHYPNWPTPRGYSPDLSLEPPSSFDRRCEWQASPLSVPEIERKQRGLEAHRSQLNYKAKYMMSFLRKNELFGNDPSLSLLDSRKDPLVLDEDETQDAMDEELTPEEQAVFLNLDRCVIGRDQNKFMMTIYFNRPMAKLVEAGIQVYGYRRDKPFSKMPKINIKAGVTRYECFNRKDKLPSGSIEVHRKARAFSVQIPFTLLGDPEKLLISARTYIGEVPLDWMSWYIVELQR